MWKLKDKITTKDTACRGSLARSLEEALCSSSHPGHWLPAFLGIRPAKSAIEISCLTSGNRDANVLIGPSARLGTSLPFFLSKADFDRCGELVGSISSEGLMDRPWA